MQGLKNLYEMPDLIEENRVILTKLTKKIGY